MQRFPAKLLSPFVVGAILGMILAVLFFVMLYIQNASPQVLPAASSTGGETRESTSQGVGDRVLEKQYSGWSYVVYRSKADRLAASIQYDKSTASALNSFAAINRNLAAQVARMGGMAQLVVTFRSPLPPDQFRAWVKKHEVLVSQTQMRIGSGPGRVTAFIKGSVNDPLPSKALEDAEASNGGVFRLDGTVAAARVLAIANDPRVFIADVTPNIVRHDLLAANVAGVENVDINPESAFWNMEELGLTNSSEETSVSNTGGVDATVTRSIPDAVPSTQPLGSDIPSEVPPAVLTVYPTLALDATPAPITPPATSLP